MSLSNFLEQLLKAAVQNAIETTLQGAVEKLLHPEGKEFLTELRNHLDDHLNK